MIKYECDGSRIVYKYPMAMTQQFRMCGNPFRIDVYKGCTFGCSYCFANTENFTSKDTFMISDFDKIEKDFYKAFETDKNYKGLNIELLRHKVPLHLGGMSDPLQSAEAKYGLTYRLLELTNKYHYPMMISTKASSFPSDDYWDKINSDIHAFQISLCGMDNDFIRKIESHTPPSEDRVGFIKQLKDKGCWVSVRLQPLISLPHAIDVVNATSSIVNYITVEHMKISTDMSMPLKKYWFDLSPYDASEYYRAGKNYELETDIKLCNIQELKKISHCSIGCGDNDLHEYSDSYNCCGIDTINDNFNNWLKYNTMYIKMTDDKSQWYPKSNCSSCFNSECRKQGYTYKDYVDDFMDKPIRKQKAHIKF